LAGLGYGYTTTGCLSAGYKRERDLGLLLLGGLQPLEHVVHSSHSLFFFGSQTVFN
jgi:hypothetical protein